MSIFALSIFSFYFLKGEVSSSGLRRIHFILQMVDSLGLPQRPKVSTYSSQLVCHTAHGHVVPMFLDFSERE